MIAPSPITFTSLLYSVVIGVAFQNVTKVELSQRNVFMGLALLIIFDDYFNYHLEIRHIKDSGPNRIYLFWMDVIILVVWYIMSLATAGTTLQFFLAVATFYALTSFWEACTADPGSRLAATIDGGLPLAATGLVIVAIELGAPGRLQDWVIPAGFLVAFLLARWRTYRRIWTSPVTPAAQSKALRPAPHARTGAGPKSRRSAAPPKRA